MTTTTPTFVPTSHSDTTVVARPRRRILRTGLAAGTVAALATTTYAAVLHAAGVSFVVSGKPIPAPGFGTMTLAAALIGTALAAALVRTVRDPRRVFLRVTLVLTALSFVPDVVAHAAYGTRVALVVSHVLAAAIVIPAVASRCGDA